MKKEVVSAYIVQIGFDIIIRIPKLEEKDQY